MKITIGNSLGLVAALFLASCQFKQEEPPDFEASILEFTRESTDITRQQLLVEVDKGFEPLNVNIVLADKDLLFRALRTQFPSVSGFDDLGGLIRGIEDVLGEKEGVPDVEEFRGYAGVLNRAFFEAARMTLGADRLFNPRVKVRLIIHGQIIHYAFDEPSGAGEIHSITYFTKIMTPNTPVDYDGLNISTTDAVRFKVSVERDVASGDDGFVVVKRDDHAPDGPFPGTMPFTRAMINDVEFYGYQYKLWARGNSITINEIALKPEGDVVFTKLPMSDPRYKIGPDSCIDMLFVREPPSDLGRLGPPFYCLGRCDHPGLVNTNADG